MSNFMSQAQSTVVRAFGLGTGAFAIWLDLARREVKVRRYDERMVIPLAWDAKGVSECALCTRAYYRGKPVDQLQMYLMGNPDVLLINDLIARSTYHIVTVSFGEEGNVISPEGVVDDFDTGSSFPTSAIVKPGITNTRVEMSHTGRACSLMR